MSNTKRRNKYFPHEKSENKVRDGSQTIEMKKKKDQKRSTKKLRKLCAEDVWDVPNHDKFGRKAP